jgi:hypothetical protein
VRKAVRPSQPYSRPQGVFPSHNNYDSCMTDLPEIAVLDPLSVALRLIDRAILLHLHGEDALFVLAMAHPGHMLLNDLVQEHRPDDFAAKAIWEDLRESGVVTRNGKKLDRIEDFYSVLHRDANSHKHHKQDKPVTLEAGVDLATLSVAIVHAEQIGAVTLTQQVFMNWLYTTNGLDNPEASAFAALHFPRIGALSKSEQRLACLRVIDALEKPSS